MALLEEDFAASWKPFIRELEEKILPVYQDHERSFDRTGIHGRMHICRAILFAEMMARYYQVQLDIDLNFYSLRIATAFHDSGRQDNGPDIWETASAERCYQYLVTDSPYAAGFTQNQPSARAISHWIDERGDRDIHQRILHDADVLEIMRPCCDHGGFAGFHSQSLRFGGDRDPNRKGFEDPENLRKAVIQEAWSWIQKTELLKENLSSSDVLMQDLLEILKSGRSFYPMLSVLVE